MYNDNDQDTEIMTVIYNYFILKFFVYLVYSKVFH